MKFCLKKLCLAAIGLAHLISPSTGDAQEFTRSTIPLKSGGSITSLESQGQRVAYLNGQAPERTADARNAFNSHGPNWNSNTNSNDGLTSNRRLTSDRHEAGFAQASSSATDGFYRSAQNAAQSGDTYPYPTLANAANARVGTGFNAQLTSTANRRDTSGADFRFDRTGFGERPSGALGDTQNAAAANRVAQLPQPPTQLPASQLPNPATALPNPAASNVGGAAQYNLGPNYVNPAANYATGYQGYQPQPQAANTVPALNIQMPAAANNNNSNCCCVPYANAGYLVPPNPGYTGYQFQPNIGTPQLNRTNAPFGSLLAGSGRTAYTPLIQFRNMPPGTYLGQGVIGQPTAYVDGQPIRNLIRYVSP